ncbi:hypothetical protein [Carnimonas nigrificans]|uniref:hypothetical protein n=1 Tax=Carnimonas nigrificans TaxID=64323 RepID=UPI00047080DC|nr:hypothetical protein [Carnimonas nigrificans]
MRRKFPNDLKLFAAVADKSNISSASWNMVRAAGLEPARSYDREIFLPATAFAAIIAMNDHVCGLDYPFIMAA